MSVTTHNPCCSSHGVDMDCATYRRTHFVEVGPCCSVWAEEHPEYGTAAEPKTPKSTAVVTAEVNVPDEAVKLAAEQIRTVAAACCQEAALAANVAGSTEDWMGEAEAALKAAAPLIERAVLERQIAGLIQVQQRLRADTERGVRVYGAYGVEEAISHARARIAELRGESR